MHVSCHVVELVPSNVENLKSLLLQHDVDVTCALCIELDVTSDVESCHDILLQWILQLEHCENFTRWEHLGRALGRIGHRTLCLEILEAVSNGRLGMYKEELL
jgi:hypothetical protein